MFRKIYEELVLIRKELQVIRNNLESEKNAKSDLEDIGLVKEAEKRYFNQAQGLTVISFQIPCHDWSLLRASTEWSQVERMLLEVRNRHNQKFQTELQD